MTVQKEPALLGGVVRKFKGNGRKLGYPTANIKTDTALRDGVYFGFATLGEYKNHPALIFIGVPTTVGDKTRRVEAHLLDIIDQNYYGLRLQLRVINFYRSSQTFDGIGQLLAAMKVDEQIARQWFKNQ